MNEKLLRVLEYFEENEIKLPIDVKNVLEDVFRENDEIDSVNCYHPEEVEVFQKDLTLTNLVKIYISGRSEGRIESNIWTYYGDIYYSLTEYIQLVEDDGKLIESISQIEDPNPTLLNDKNSYAVVLKEVVEWSTPDNLTRTPTLYIYCPIPADGEPHPENTKYDKIYNQLVEERENE